MTLLKLFDRHTEEKKARVGIDVAAGSISTYIYTRRAIAEFVQKKYNATDIAFGQLNEHIYS